MVATRTVRRFTEDEYRRSVAGGVFRDPDAMQFIGGVIYDAPSTGEVPRLHHFTVDEYQHMGELGVLTTDSRVELLEGEIVGKPVHGTRHVRCMYQLQRFMQRRALDDLFIGFQTAIRLNDNTEPEPDMTITRDWDYVRTNPTPADVLLVLEVADSSIREDRNEKVPRYARAGIPEVWLVDLTTDTVERHTEPRDGRYQQLLTARAGEMLASAVVPSLVIPVADVLR